MYLTLVPEVFLFFIAWAARDPQSGKHRSHKAVRKKNLFTLDLNLTFMQMTGSWSDPSAQIGWYFYKQPNKYDWSIWLAITRGQWGYLLLPFFCVYMYLYQGKKLLAKYCSSQFLQTININNFCLCSTMILFLTVPLKEFDLCTQGAFSRDWKCQRTSKPCLQS